MTTEMFMFLPFFSARKMQFFILLVQIYITFVVGRVSIICYN